MWLLVIPSALSSDNSSSAYRLADNVSNRGANRVGDIDEELQTKPKHVVALQVGSRLCERSNRLLPTATQTSNETSDTHDDVKQVNDTRA